MTESDDKKPMCFRRQIEEIIELKNSRITLENIQINGKNYDLKIQNHSGRLSLDFNDGEYNITIDEEGIRFDRLLRRPNHDHNDSQSLQIGVDDNVMGVKIGEILWRSRFPYQKEGYEHFCVEFGDRTEGY